LRDIIDQTLNYKMIISNKEHKNIIALEKPEHQIIAIKEFIINFNKEAKKRNSKWFAELLFKQFPHITKRNGIIDFFLCRMEPSFQVIDSGGYFFFVDNDYICNSIGRKFSDRFFKHLPEFKPILEAIPQKVYILWDNENLMGNIENIEKEILKLKNGKK